MEVILLEKMKNLGPLGARVKVKPGYARNFLLPQGKATPATTANVAAFEARRAELERAERDLLNAAKNRGDAIAALGIVVVRQRAGAEGRLFGSVGASDVAFALSDAGVQVAKSEVRLTSGPLRTIGDHTVNLHLHAEVSATVTISVVADA